MKLMKFGGTSVGSIKALRDLIALVASQGANIVVVSAFSGVTDALIQLARLAARGCEAAAAPRSAAPPAQSALAAPLRSAAAIPGAGTADAAQAFEALRRRHDQMAGALITEAILNAPDGTQAFVDAAFKELEGILLGLRLLHELSPRALDLVMSFGERLSSRIVADAFCSAGYPARAVDARAIIKTDASFGAAHYLEAETEAAAKVAFADTSVISIVTGFLGSTIDGLSTTLGRGGSDYSAGILGACLGADEIQICTDVDGILTADPRLVPDAFLMEEISYEEALELTHFGAKVLHPPTLRPAMAKGIPIRIRNTSNPDCPGTLIRANVGEPKHPVRGIASLGPIALVRVQGPGLIGVQGTAGRLFGCLAASGVNVILITQASSEYSICFAVRPEDIEHAASAVHKEFILEIGAGLIQEPHIESNLSVVAIVGAGMRSRPGISSRLFGALGRNGINIVAIAQGSSELNISVVISSRDEAKALNAIHSAFFLSDIKAIKLFLAGTGTIGRTLLTQLAAQKKELLARHSIRIDLVGLANSRRMLIRPKGIDPSQWETVLAEGEKSDTGLFIANMKALNLSGMVLCDCTASDTLPDFYEEILRAAIGIVTPNKRANAGPLLRYKKITRYSQEAGIPYRYETTVGAGLPVIGPLQDMVNSGDRILRIEAVLSGTISYILNTFSEGGVKFSELVRKAQNMGYTEPDPRDDLSAADAARKTMILAREAGIDLDIADIAIQPIVPASCFDSSSVEEFYKELAAHDSEFAFMRAAAAKAGAVLRYVAVIESSGKASIAMRESMPDDPFFALSGADNMVVFTTDRYKERPLVVKGPGAGPELTAGGVFADIVRIAKAGA